MPKLIGPEEIEHCNRALIDQVFARLLTISTPDSSKRVIIISMANFALRDLCLDR